MTIDECKEFLPKEAIEAMDTGGDWDGKQHTADAADGPDWYWVDDDHEEDEEDGGWRKSSYPEGWEVEKGVLLHTWHSVDEDGNWDFNDAAPVGSPEEASLEKEFGHEAWLKTYHEYCAWVAETGKDPMNEFFTAKTADERIRLARAILKPVEKETK
jgi:hypothetical protein